MQEIATPGFAVSLVYVTYAYTGWNAAAYIVEEIQDVQKSLPKALILGTLVVTVLYVLLQLVFLKNASYAQLEGQVEVATIAFSNVFEASGSRWISFFIALQLVATISAYIWIGSRVTHAMSREHSLWKPLRKLNTQRISHSYDLAPRRYQRSVGADWYFRANSTLYWLYSTTDGHFGGRQCLISEKSDPILFQSPLYPLRAVHFHRIQLMDFGLHPL